MQSTFKRLTKDSISSRLEKLVFTATSFAFLNAESSKKSPVAIMDSYKVLVMLQGHAKIYLGSDTYYTRRGDCVLFAPGSLYHAEISSQENCHFISINFNLENSAQNAVFANLLGIKDIAIYPALAPD